MYSGILVLWIVPIFPKTVDRFTLQCYYYIVFFHFVAKILSLPRDKIAPFRKAERG